MLFLSRSPTLSLLQSQFVLNRTEYGMRIELNVELFAINNSPTFMRPFVFRIPITYFPPFYSFLFHWIAVRSVLRCWCRLIFVFFLIVDVFFHSLLNALTINILCSFSIYIKHKLTHKKNVFLFYFAPTLLCLRYFFNGFSRFFYWRLYSKLYGELPLCHRR